MNSPAKTDQRPQPPELIVAKNAEQADYIRRQLKAHPHIRVIWKLTVQSIAGAAYARIVVCAGVDLYQDVDGEGILRELLRSRQITFGASALFLAL